MTISVNFFESDSENHLAADSMVISRKTGDDVFSRHPMPCSGYDPFQKFTCIEWADVLESIAFDSVVVEGYVSETPFCPEGGYGRLAVAPPSRDAGYLVHIRCL